jgi:L-iditol 2-dehydrogenase
MRVAVYFSNTDIRIEERDVPKIGPGEMLVKVMASGICGSDVMEWYRRDKVPLVLGHEIAGEVVELGQGVEGFSVGDQVSASHHVPCMTCHYCRKGHHTACETLRTTNFDPGGFAEYVRLPAINVQRGTYKLDPCVDVVGGTFTEPLACVLRGQRKMDLQPGNNVLVIGCGISGLMHVDLAAALGAGRIVATDLSEFRLKKARELGAEETFLATEFTPDLLKDIFCGRMADRVILTTGAIPAINQGLASLERGGTVLFFAPMDEGQKYELDINKVFWRNDTTLTTTYAGSPDDHYLALDLIAARRVHPEKMITHMLPLDRIVEGFKLVAEGNESIKVIIEPNS